MMNTFRFPVRFFLKPGNFSFYRNYKNYRQYSAADIFAVSVVLYDHACPLCRTEMQRLKRRDKYARLVLIDIDSPAFNEQTWGVSRSQAGRALHVLTPDDEWLVGMSAIRHVYQQVGLGWLLAITQWPLLSSVADLAYRYIAPNRQVISRWLGLETTSSPCAETVCRYTNNDKGRVGDD
jgi:predicted DCC family thiol-disulfide oxidoreductase YuxK